MKLNLAQTALSAMTLALGIHASAGDAPAAVIKLDASYASIKANIIDTKCLKCHSPGGKAEGIPLVSKDDLLKGKLDEGTPDERLLVTAGKAMTSPFFLVMNKDATIRGNLKQMPPVKAVQAGFVPDVTADDLQVVQAWINGGATN